MWMRNLRTKAGKPGRSWDSSELQKMECSKSSSCLLRKDTKWYSSDQEGFFTPQCLERKKIKSNWLLMGTHQVISTFQQEEYLLFISATICVFIFRTGQMLQDKHNMSMLLCHFSGQDKCCKTNITWICYSASTAKCSSQDFLLLLLSPLNQPKEILMERLTAKWLSQMDTYHQIYSIPR